MGIGVLKPLLLERLTTAVSVTSESSDSEDAENGRINVDVEVGDWDGMELQ